MTTTRADKEAYYDQFRCPYCGKIGCGYHEEAEFDGVKFGGCKNTKG